MSLSNLTMIGAIDRTGLIGDGDQLPWKGIKEDTQHLFETIDGASIIIGKKTYESLPQKARETINERTNVYVLSQTQQDCYSFDEILKIAFTEEEENPDHQFFVLGGAHVYSMFFEWANEIILTHLDFKVDLVSNPVYIPIDPQTLLDNFKIYNEKPISKGYIVYYKRKEED